MAKTEGTQSIPSALLDSYRATLGEQRPNTRVEKRYPYRLPLMQGGRPDETPAQRAQRDKLKAAIVKFKALSPADRARWYARMPPWSSYLWYYNWFMLNAIPNLWQAIPGGDAVLNNIQVIQTTLGTDGGLINIPITVMATKCVVMLQGAGYNYGEESAEYIARAWAWAVYPVVSSISNTQIDLRWAMTVYVPAKVSATIIEYI